MECSAAYRTILISLGKEVPSLPASIPQGGIHIFEMPAISFKLSGEAGNHGKQ